MDNNQFQIFHIDRDILQAIKDLGYEQPTKVQEAVIPAALEGRDLIVKAQTGSGKTAAFAIPICQRINIEERDPQVLVLTPTRELAVQVKADITTIGRYKKIRCAAIYGKQPIQLQTRELKQRVHAVVGTPGRVIDHIERGNLVLDKIKILILDESDEMLSMGFVDQVEAILKELPKDKTTMLFSATMPEIIVGLCRKYLVKPEMIEVDSGSLTVEKTNQGYYMVEEHEKFDSLIKVLYRENPDSCILFCRTKDRVDTLAGKIKQLDYPCRELHGGLMQDERLASMQAFKRGEFRFLVATDVAARGIDVEDVSLVVNYDVPMEKESYVHRIGRTGRAGSEGKAITLVTPYEDKFLMNIKDFIGIDIPLIALPSEDEMEANKEAFLHKNSMKPLLKLEKSSKLNKEIMKLYIGAGKSNKIRPGDIMGAISNIEGVDAEDIGIIDIQQDISYVDIMNNKGHLVLQALKEGKIKGKSIRVERSFK